MSTNNSKIPDFHKLLHKKEKDGREKAGQNQKRRKDIKVVKHYKDSRISEKN